MASSARRRPGFSPTTIILILLLLGAVAGASRLVTPAPPKPPEEPKQEVQQQAQTQAARTSAMEDIQKKHLQQAQALQREEALTQAKAPAMADPSQPDVTNNYFLSHKPGMEGVKQVDSEQQAKEARYQKFRQEMQKAEEKVKAASPKAPYGTSPPEPGPGIPPASPAAAH